MAELVKDQKLEDEMTKDEVVEDVVDINPLIYCALALKKMFRKLLKILNQQDPNFFLFVLLELWLVYHFPRFLQFFDVGAQS